MQNGDAPASRSRGARLPSGEPTGGDQVGDANFPVVGIGASAGGLDACKRLMRSLPDVSGMAFILVQHLDPTHKSMMVDLLAEHTSMTVCEAADGMRLAPEHLYVIPPGCYLAISDGILRLSEPQARHGTRLPFDFLLHSLAHGYGQRAICVVLSGTGADGSLGLCAVKEQGGLVIVQSPDDASFDGMPRSAIATGAVDLVLPLAEISGALIKHAARHRASLAGGGRTGPKEDCLPEIVGLLRAKTAYDFTLYKPGTLRRRIQRRMTMQGVDIGDMATYLSLLRGDSGELGLLAKDMLINVSGFFRDPKVFDLLAATVVPDLIHSRAPSDTLRIWIAGCSSGEELYSFAILLHEQIAAAKHNVKLQIFASDVDPDAIAAAREGVYDRSIEEHVSPARLARFFSQEDGRYRVAPELRSGVVFTVQDVLADPPFSRLDLISCRNLLIYLRAEAQAKVLSLFHFALSNGGILLLGGSETVATAEGRFEVISKPERLYRRVGPSRQSDYSLPVGIRGEIRQAAHSGQRLPSRQVAFAELCQRMIVEHYAPAAALINAKHECLYTVGPTDRYLRVARGQPSHDLFAMVRQDLRVKLRSATERSRRENARVAISGCRIKDNGRAVSISIDVRPVSSHGEDLLLVCFVEETALEEKHDSLTAPQDVSRVSELEQELQATRAELQGAIRDLELSGEEQKAINEEVLSVNEEYQSANEELLTSKEELQALNEELTALNSQLQETLDRQRTTSNDLQNILYSTDVATLFLDTDLNIRFFTPTTRSIFHVIPSDVGRPLADLSSLAVDAALQGDARAVLTTLAPLQREIQTESGLWFLRRILPYRTHERQVEGVVITFADITERKEAAREAEVAKQQAELANILKSRFLAAASHDLRQPLQTLSLLQELLEKHVEGERGRKLVAKLDSTLNAMSGILNTLLDINQIEAGVVQPEMVDFPINDLLDRLRDEFAYHAEAQKLAFRVVPCGLWVRSDPRLLEQMLRNLLSNAFKYTKRGKVLLGCRRREGMLSIEVGDTGDGIPARELDAIFEEFHQLDNTARERSRGLGLGLSIVQRLGNLLGHRANVRSVPGKGSIFAIAVKILPRASPSNPDDPEALDAADDADAPRTGTVLIVDDDPELREHLHALIAGDRHHVIAAADGVAALALMTRSAVLPDVVLADYNLPNGMDGLQMVARLRETLGWQIPVIILTGDISNDTFRNIALQNCTQLNKPVKWRELAQAIQRLLPPRQHAPAKAARPSVIFLVDDDDLVRDIILTALEDDGHAVEAYASAEEFIAAYHPGCSGCLLIDATLPGMSGLELLQWLQDAGHRLPAIMITGNSDVRMAVKAMKTGALDFIEKPIGRTELLYSVKRALEQSEDLGKLAARQQTAANYIGSLTSRERQILDMVLAGHPSKNIAAELGISQRTVENHRASIMRKTGSKSLPALARLVLAANGDDA